MENKLMRACEVAKELDVSLSYAYKLIKQLNEELRQKGYITFSGKVNRRYLHERVYVMETEEKKNACV